MAVVAGLAEGTWAIDPSHSEVGFTVRHLMVSKVRGTLAGVAGTITVSDAEVAVAATVDAASINTRDENRDGHIKSADFFDVENHPTWTFASTGFQAKGNDIKLTGDLTLRGVTKSVELDVEFVGVNTDPWGNTKAGFEAKGEINRKDFGVEWNAPLETGGVLVGEKVNIELNIQAALQK
ncbi:MAG: YceI family protein [Candidatus Nanopelagicales bacterium]